MITVITYGTFDILHYGHIRLLKRARELGDYLIVGVTADDYDKTRGKINVRQSLMERIEAVRATGLADKIIVEEYDGQKIDDIKRYDVDIFTVGSDWIGKFDYLKEYCKVIYLERTQGISSSDIRALDREIRIGLVGESVGVGKFLRECQYVNGGKVVGIYAEDLNNLVALRSETPSLFLTDKYEELLEKSDAVYIASHPSAHAEQIRLALSKGKHVLCESPIVLQKESLLELRQLARDNKCVLMPAIKTAYSTAYNRLLLLAKSGKIGKIVSVDATCTSLKKIDAEDPNIFLTVWNSICMWGPTALLPVFQLLGTDYVKKTSITHYLNWKENFDSFTKIDFIYPQAVASIKVGQGVKSEGELIVSGTQGYIHVPAPWWKTDYFEIRYENPENNRRYFYQLDGEGIRYEIVAFVKSIERGTNAAYWIDHKVSETIIDVIEDFYQKKDLWVI